MPGRGHALTIDSGWHEVAGTALTFVQRSNITGANYLIDGGLIKTT